MYARLVVTLLVSRSFVRNALKRRGAPLFDHPGQLWDIPQWNAPSRAVMARTNGRHDDHAPLPTESEPSAYGGTDSRGSTCLDARNRPRDGGPNGMKTYSAHPVTPRFDVSIKPPDLRPWLTVEHEIPGVVTRESSLPGPHVALLSLMHGNEFSGAIVLDRLLRQNVLPRRGTLSFVFVNLAAFARFDPDRPTLSRFIDEDINRLWEASILDGPRHSYELDRAREIRPLIDRADVVLDLHSMLWPSDPLILCGSSHHGRALAHAIGWPPTVVADTGHANGTRLIDYARFKSADAAAVLLEAGQHWSPKTIDTAGSTVFGLLRHLELVEANRLPPKPSAQTPSRFALVTDVITARTSTFSFTHEWHGGEVVEKRDTLIGTDGETEVRTPYDNCLLVMPSLRPAKGHTAIRFAALSGSEVV